VNRKYTIGMLGLLLLTGIARAQSDGDVTNLPTPPEPERIVPHQLSDWITFASKDFAPPPGMVLRPSPPIGTELFVLAGPSAPFGSGTYGHTLDVGWTIEGGARALFYNPNFDRAWVIEGMISNTFNRSNSSSPVYPTTLKIFENSVFTTQPVTVRDLNQTFVNLGFGHDWYLWHSESSNRSLSFGFDTGGRWGTAKADFNEITHRTGQLYGAYGAVHVDLVVPCGGCFQFVCGVRGEYDLMQNNNLLQSTFTLQEASLLFNVGLRF
jgi:hypothetical protein